MLPGVRQSMKNRTMVFRNEHTEPPLACAARTAWCLPPPPSLPGPGMRVPLGEGSLVGLVVSVPSALSNQEGDACDSGHLAVGGQHKVLALRDGCSPHSPWRWTLGPLLPRGSGLCYCTPRAETQWPGLWGLSRGLRKCWPAVTEDGASFSTSSFSPGGVGVSSGPQAAQDKDPAPALSPGTLCSLKPRVWLHSRAVGGSKVGDDRGPWEGR